MDLDDIKLKPSNDGMVRFPYSVDSTVSKREFFTTSKLILLGVLGISTVLLFTSISNSSLRGEVKFVLLTLLVVFDIVVIVIKVFDVLYYRKVLSRLEADDYKFGTDITWGLYDISPVSVRGTLFHVLYYTTGMQGVIVRLEHNTKVGKGDDIEYEHYAAIGEAYKVLGSYDDVAFVHLDVMGSVGDDRLQSLYSQLSKCENSDVRSLLLSVYDNLSLTTESLYHEHDIYLFLGSQEDVQFLNKISYALQIFLRANYLRYVVLDRRGIRDLQISLLNIPTFSVSDACDDVEVAQGSGSDSLRVLWTVKDGVKTTLAAELPRTGGGFPSGSGSSVLSKKKKKKR